MIKLFFEPLNSVCGFVRDDYGACWIGKIYSRSFHLLKSINSRFPSASRLLCLSDWLKVESMGERGHDI